ncbi:winged helix-turn-helix domain-containing protein [Allopontixanthobacter sediminis]|uniref:Transcriptional regulator n=1 Tax=Allopontixanthobacter sediminis TaxID=1689985 RepID=A0A845B075_9SPHN|nr:transcriptional regulator [Allopontixanthobacter sediminis]MXP43072.1 transcriptional regulator [Allopontixanthobacter sediminis]
MSHSPVYFGPFQLDLADRRLSRGGDTVDLNARYMDALILLVAAEGKLVAKERFMDEVWRGVPVTDEALTQAIRTLRRALGDSAATPRFIETVPKHGYRFIAPVGALVSTDRIQLSDPAEMTGGREEALHSAFIRQTLAGCTGALVAGALVGLLYGFIGSAQPTGGGGSAASILLVLVLVSMFSAGVAGFGIAAGIAAAATFIRPATIYWTVTGGALGGLAMGAFANLLGNDLFRLLFGKAPGVFAGALEGLILGGTIGLAVLYAGKGAASRLAVAALLGLFAGMLITLVDGRMMAGSLQELVSAFPTSRYRLDGIGSAFGEDGLGPIGRAVTAGFEGAVFSVGIVWAMRRAAARTNSGYRSRDQSRSAPNV